MTFVASQKGRRGPSRKHVLPRNSRTGIATRRSRKKPSKHVEEPTVTTSASEPGSNNKKLFAYIKDMKCYSSGVAPLKKDDINYSEPTDQVEILNEQFVSAFTKEDCTSIPTMGNSTVNSAPPLNIQANGVKKLLLSQIPHKSSGPDQSSPRFLKELASPIAPALALIYPASYEQGQVPDDWKRAFVTPLFKNGDKSKASNYRPVSLTSCCCKVMKHIVHSHLMKFLENNKILSDYQHGFRKKRSCRLSSSPLYMTSQLDWTDGNKLMQFCWISERLLIRFPISALQSSSITMTSETKTHPGSKAFSRIEISKWSLMGRIISCCCHIQSSTRHSAWASPVPGIHQ